jgi:hypothetical protein
LWKKYPFQVDESFLSFYRIKKKLAPDILLLTKTENPSFVRSSSSSSFSVDLETAELQTGMLHEFNQPLV